MYGVPEHAMQLSLRLEDQEEEPPQGAPTLYTLSVPSLDGKPRLNAPPAAPARSRGLRMTPSCRVFRNRFFPAATDAEWSDWRWQVQHRVHDLETVRRKIGRASCRERVYDDV